MNSATSGVLQRSRHIAEPLIRCALTRPVGSRGLHAHDEAKAITIATTNRPSAIMLNNFWIGIPRGRGLISLNSGSLHAVPGKTGAISMETKVVAATPAATSKMGMV